MTYFCSIWDTLLQLAKRVLSNSSNIKDLIEAIIAIIGGVFAISGIKALRSMREKKAAATFSYWSQLLIRLKQVRNRLSNNPSLINSLYSSSCKMTWANTGAPCSTDELKSFKALAEQTLEFLKTAQDQMPAYPGWTKDLGEISTFLDDLIMYDIASDSGRDKYTEGTENDRNIVCDNICDTIERLTTAIICRQSAQEKRLCKKSD